MIFGIGCDITDIARIERALDRFGDHFLQRILSKREQAGLHGPTASYVAGRFAAKEATAKAFGTGFRNGLWMTQIEILNNDLGAPCVHLCEAARAFAEHHNIGHCFLSISHEQRFAVAYVVLEKR